MITGCGYKKTFNSEFYCKKLNFNCVRKNQRIIFRTSKGDLEAELFGEHNPITVTNFIENIKKDIYKNKKFYKIINFPQIQVIHSGALSENEYYKKEKQIFSKISPSIPLEIKLNNESEPRYKYVIKTPSEIPNLEKIFENGSLAMVKSGRINSSSTEFFFVTNKFPVVKGIEILKKITNEDLIYEVLVFD